MEIGKKEKKVTLSISILESNKIWLDNTSKKTGYNISEIIDKLLTRQKNLIATSAK